MLFVHQTSSTVFLELQMHTLQWQYILAECEGVNIHLQVTDFELKLGFLADEKLKSSLTLMSTLMSR